MYKEHLIPRFQLRQKVTVISVGFYHEMVGEIINFSYDEDEEIVLYDILFEDKNVYPQYKHTRPGSYHVGVLREQDIEEL